MTRKKAEPKPDPVDRAGRKEERYLSCKKCHLAVTLNLAPQQRRPTHRCAAVYKAMPFDIDLPADKAPKRKWYENKPKAPRPPAPVDRRPEIVL